MLREEVVETNLPKDYFIDVELRKDVARAVIYNGLTELKGQHDYSETALFSVKASKSDLSKLNGFTYDAPVTKPYKSSSNLKYGLLEGEEVIFEVPKAKLAEFLQIVNANDIEFHPANNTAIKAMHRKRAHKDMAFDGDHQELDGAADEYVDSIIKLMLNGSTKDKIASQRKMTALRWDGFIARAGMTIVFAALLTGAFSASYDAYISDPVYDTYRSALLVGSVLLGIFMAITYIGSAAYVVYDLYHGPQRLRVDDEQEMMKIIDSSVNVSINTEEAVMKAPCAEAKGKWEQFIKAKNKESTHDKSISRHLV